ncbi:pectinesterase-like [Olea europaea var. sylvestris]|uniref:Pectinesterase n=2 Tax=Olea europaea subsp. europaea TaxID=158383 RepID=A0A8S0R5L0_OLEEU|nr:pectinesterase-like [Olea europaea var. sylvestris]CAA2974593.1 plant invertase pectin methylesterase inhibitor superfamily [Olea europaea subsp. europaea]
MATLECAVILLLVILSSCSVSWSTKNPYEENIGLQCGFTRHPSLCAETLRVSGSRNQADFISVLVNKTIYESKLPVSNFEQLSVHFVSREAQHARMAIDYCHELIGMSLKRLNQALDALKDSPRKHKSDIQTWLSAALTFQQTCKDEAETHAPSNVFMADISKKMDYLSQLVSNPLALVNRITGKTRTKTPSGRRLMEERIFPSWVSASDRKLLQSTEIKANAVVAKDGTGNYKTISEAIQAATGNRFVIHVKSGVYSEKINTKKDGITLIGDGKYSTIVSGSSNVGNGGSSLRGSATFTITGDGFIARDIGFQNTAGPNAEQAVALNVASDHSVLYRCSLVAYQDTLYAHSMRQFYRECDIYGTVDFIFGNAVAVFQSCNLVLRQPRSGGAYDVILANGRSDPGQNTGFSVQNCRINRGSDYSAAKSAYLGRPWKEYSRAVVMQSTIDAAISSRGWVEWPGSSGSAYKTLYFAEFENIGPGASTSGRVNWPGFHVIGRPEATKFTVANFIGGTSWLPSTGVTFVSGL